MKRKVDRCRVSCHLCNADVLDSGLGDQHFVQQFECECTQRHGHGESAGTSVRWTRNRISRRFYSQRCSLGHLRQFHRPCPTGSNVNDINLEIYRVFPNDSQDPPNPLVVPTRANSPSDVAFAESGAASIIATVLAPNFTATNSVLNGIIASMTPTTGGDGPVTGQEVRFDVVLLNPFLLPADHYFFVPQVGLTSGNFFWLSAARPIPNGSPNTPINPDLQEWIRNGNLDPNWLRVGTDIVGGNPGSHVQHGI